jgi:hypothetical protein
LGSPEQPAIGIEEAGSESPEGPFRHREVAGVEDFMSCAQSHGRRDAGAAGGIVEDFRLIEETGPKAAIQMTVADPYSYAYLFGYQGRRTVGG